MSEPLSSVRITVLVENSVYRAGLRAEHGLSLLIETPFDTILFDTGQTDLLLHNARALGVDLNRVTCCVLSHGHYDHAGGLLAALDVLPSSVIVHAHPDVWTERWSLRPGQQPRNIGMDPDLRQYRDRFSLHPSPATVCPGVTFLGSIRRCYDEGSGLSGFFTDVDGTNPDTLPDDSGVLIDTAAGLVLITGCGHAGVRNYLDHARKLAPGRPWAMVLGGLHLRSASDEHLADAVDALQQASVPHVGAMHCTGVRGLVALSSGANLTVSALPVGSKRTVSECAGINRHVLEGERALR